MKTYGTIRFTDDIEKPLYGKYDPDIVTSADIRAIQSTIDRLSSNYDAQRGFIERCRFIMSDKTTTLSTQLFTDDCHNVVDVIIPSFPESILTIDDNAFDMSYFSATLHYALPGYMPFLPNCISVGVGAFKGACMDGIYAPMLQVIPNECFMATLHRSNPNIGQFQFDSARYIGSRSFYNAFLPGAQVIIPQVSTIDDYAFAYATVSSIYAPNLINVQSHAFYRCLGIEHLDFPKLTASYNSFDNMPDLTGIYVPNFPAFELANNCGELTRATVSATYTQSTRAEIADSFNATALTSLTLKSSEVNLAEAYIGSSFNYMEPTDVVLSIISESQISNIHLLDSFAHTTFPTVIFSANNSHTSDIILSRSFTDLPDISFDNASDIQKYCQMICDSASMIRSSYKSFNWRNRQSWPSSHMINVDFPKATVITESFDNATMISSMSFGRDIYDFTPPQNNALSQLAFNLCPESQVITMDSYPFGMNPDRITTGQIPDTIAFSNGVSCKLTKDYVQQVINACKINLNKIKTLAILNHQAKISTTDSRDVFRALDHVQTIRFCPYVDKYAITSWKLSAIPDYTFEDFSQLTAIENLENVYDIGKNAFWSCSSLKYANIGNARNISDYAFSNCSQLTYSGDIYATSIGKSAFENCHNILPTLIVCAQNIGNSAFARTMQNGKISLNVNARGINDFAFLDCQALTSLSVAISNYGTIGKGIAAYCNNLQSINIQPTTTGYHAIQSNHGIALNNHLVMGTNQLTSLPTTITDLHPSSYQGMAKISTITGTSQLTSIGESTFKDCTALTSINLENCKTIPNSAFESCRSLRSVTGKWTMIGSYAFAYCKSLAQLSNLSACTSIGNNAFYQSDIRTMKQINLSSIEYIGNAAFANVSADTIEIGDKLANLPSNCFAGSTINRVKMNSPEIMIGNGSFINSSIQHVELGDGSHISSIGCEAFYNCTRLRSFPKFSEELRVIDDRAFYHATSFSPTGTFEGISSIGDHAFCDSGISGTVNLYDAVIGTSAFRQTAIESVKLNGKLNAHINSDVFAYNSHLDNVQFTESLPIQFYSECFRATRLRDVKFTLSAEAIQEYAFADNTSLTSIEFGPDLTQIDETALANDKNLMTIHVDPLNEHYSSTILNDQPHDSYLIRMDGTDMTLVFAANGFDFNKLEGIANICPYAFTTTNMLTSITIPTTVTADVDQLLLPETIVSLSVAPGNPVYSLLAGSIVEQIQPDEYKLVKLGIDPVDPTRNRVLPDMIIDVYQNALNRLPISTIDLRLNSRLSVIAESHMFTDDNNLSSLLLPNDLAEIGSETFHILSWSLRHLDLSHTKLSCNHNIFGEYLSSLALPATYDFMNLSEITPRLKKLEVNCPLSVITSAPGYPWGAAKVVSIYEGQTGKLDLPNNIKRTALSSPGGNVYAKQNEYVIDLRTIDNEVASDDIAYHYIQTRYGDVKKFETTTWINASVVNDSIRENDGISLSVAYSNNAYGDKPYEFYRLIKCDTLSSIMFRSANDLLSSCPLFSGPLDDMVVENDFNNLTSITALSSTTEFDILSESGAIIRLDPTLDYLPAIVQVESEFSIPSHARLIVDKALVGCRQKTYNIPKTIIGFTGNPFTPNRELSITFDDRTLQDIKNEFSDFIQIAETNNYTIIPGKTT